METERKEPETEEEIDAFLRDHGYDPDEVAAQGRAIAGNALEKVRRSQLRKLWDWVMGC